MANTPPEDTELEVLLTRLLRMVSPGFAADGGLLAIHSGQAAGQAGPLEQFEPAGRIATPGSAAAAGPAQSGIPALPAAESALAPAISASEARALIELVTARGIAQGELAGLLGLDKSTVSRLAASLERKGWVRRGRDDVNQRYVRLYLTPQGGQMATRVWQAWQSRQARVLAALSADERAGLTAGLRGLIRGLGAEGQLAEHSGHGG
jgi:DNA-binding MarR family transcriptional regulator